MCGGVPYRQCPQDNAGTLGICIGLRLGILMCLHDTYAITVRQKQNQRGIGIPCHPVEEAWLECNATNQ